MDVMKMRERLTVYCKGKYCEKCKLKSSVCRCGCKVHFLSKRNGKYAMTDEEIIEAFAIAFPDECTRLLAEYCEKHHCFKCVFTNASCAFALLPSDELAKRLLKIKDGPEKAEESGESTCTCDSINHPAHYKTDQCECIDVMMETQGVDAVKAFCKCNAFKYLYRAEKKNGLEDIKKAIWYLNKFVELEEKDD